MTRNVTWNLENPEKAYAQWLRVLKPGGVLFNFDADWYGYLFDEEKRKGYEEDRKNITEQGAEDLNAGTGVNMDAMEQIARQVPLSRMNRPEWDVETMRHAGYEKVFYDPEVWREVWGKDDIINGGSTPMFLLTGKKAEAESGPFLQKLAGRESYTLENLAVPSGGRVSGELSLADGTIRLPVTVIHGKKPGKTVLITAGIHAGEYVGIESTVQLARTLNPEKVLGTVILVPVVNRSAFENRSGSMGRTDGKNLNRVFPGDPQGTEMERLAHALSTELLPKTDYYIDLHSGDLYEELTPYVYYAGVGKEAVVQASRRMAEQVDVPYMVRSNVGSGGAYNYAASALDIPSVLIERGGMGGWSQEEAGSTRRDVKNILVSLGAYEGERDYRAYYPIEVGDIRYQDASHGGLWYPAKSAGDVISQGDVLGEVRDYQGNILEVSVADYDGVILYQTASLQVVGNDSMIAYGRILPVKDERKERIVHYWGQRSESFLSQRREELHDPISERWLIEIHRFIPEKKPLKILDVGCGTGYFSILLAKEGHQVTGIDLTPEMIENAKALAEEEQADCVFQVMDAEHPDFRDESFDLVISRNLTWTLPHPETAYQEWLRVLKKGGVLLNFDANYGLEDVTDTAGLPKNHAHNTLQDAMLQECEEIKRQLPISSLVRPAWDLETLGKLNAEQFTIDLGVSRRIYLKKDAFYNPTPLFMLSVVK